VGRLVDVSASTAIRTWEMTHKFAKHETVQSVNRVYRWMLPVWQVLRYKSPLVWAGIAVTCAILVWSRVAVINAIAGYAGGIVIVKLLEACGLYWLGWFAGHNYLLAGMALGAVYFVPSWSSLALACLGGAVAALHVAAVQHFLVPAGAVQAFAMDTVPSGWLAANGSAVSRTAFAALFAAIGTTYGEGDGSTTFTLPDLRGYFVRGSGTNSDGTAAGTFGAKQADGVISHTHSGTTQNDNLSSKLINFQAFSGGSLNNILIQSAVVNTNPIIFHQHNFTTSSQSPAGTTETRPRNIAMLYCIKA
jgi:microcystin-dependent protein